VLEELRIRGLGVIDDAVLPLGPGLTVVTGETGAGKTMVVTGLLLLFGGRADSDRVRAGADQAIVDGRLVLDPSGSSSAAAVAAGVADAGGELDDDGSLVLRRVVSPAGRSRAHVGGAPAPVGVLARLSEQLLAVHGQSDQLRLARPAEQRGALDRYAGLDTAPFAAAFERWRAADERLTDRLARTRELQREADLLSAGLAEIEAADPQPGEDVELATEAGRLTHSDGLRLAARQAHDALMGDPDDPSTEAADVTSLLAVAGRALSQEAGDDPQLDALARRVTELTGLAADLGSELSQYVDRLDADPARLATVQDRRAVLTALTRRYAEDIDGVLAWAQQASEQLRDLDVSDSALAALAAERDAAAGEASELALELRTNRLAAADRLAAAVTGELTGLAMPSAQVRIAVRPRAPITGSPVLDVGGAPAGVSPNGADEVELLLRAHPDAPELPIQRGASGGELSRVMLALEVSLADTDPVPTMVFDEVDAGVGGRAAVEVGRRLARLARDRQVLVVTHLAQVAAYADRHIVVDKSGADGVTRSDVRLVQGADRTVELSRMLGGHDSSTARDHAAELLALAKADFAASGDQPVKAASGGRARPARTVPRRSRRAKSDS
jgi:DNA repair protein RecN (Recombination protein N)